MGIIRTFKELPQNDRAFVLVVFLPLVGVLIVSLVVGLVGGSEAGTLAEMILMLVWLIGVSIHITFSGRRRE